MVHQFIYRYQKTIYILFAGILAVLLLNGAVAFIRADAESRERFSVVQNSMQNIASQISSLEAIERTNLAVTQGNGVIADINCWPDESCPLIRRSWFVAVEKGKEGELIKSLLNNGYTVNPKLSMDRCSFSSTIDQCYAQAVNTSNARVSIYVTAAAEDLVPKQNIFPRFWREFYVTSDYVKYDYQK